MDLASLQIKITELGVEKAIQSLEKLEGKATGLVYTLEFLSKKNASFDAIAKGITLVGESAALANTSVKTLRGLLDSLGVGKLSQLITSVDRLSSSTIKASSAATRLKLDLEKVAQAEARTAQETAKADQQLERKRQLFQQTAAQSQIYQHAIVAASQNVNNVIAQGNNIQQKGIAAQNNAATSAVRLANAQQMAAHHLAKHNQTWIDHIRIVTGGIILYQGIRTALASIIGAFRAGTQAVDDFQVSTTQIAAILASLAKTGDPGENFIKAKKYAENLMPTLQQIDIRTTLNLENLVKITEEMAKQGVYMKTSSAEQVEGFTRIANAVALYSRNGQDVRQVQQEIRSALQGQHRDSDQLGKLLYSIYGEKLKPMLANWQKQGTTLQEIGKLLASFGPASDELANSWSAVTSSAKTAFDILSREALTPIIKDLVGYIKDFNKYLLDNKKSIADTIQNGWNALNSVIQIFVDNGWIVKTILFIIGETINTTASIIDSAARTIDAALQDIARLTDMAFGKQSQEQIDTYGNRWQIASAIIGGTALTINQAFIAIITSLKLVGNAFITANDIATKTIFFGSQGNPLDAFNDGAKRQKAIFAEYNSELTYAQKNYEKRLGQIYNPTKASPSNGYDTPGFDLKGLGSAGGAGKGTGDKAESLARRYAAELLNVDNLLKSVTSKQSDYDTEVAKYQKILNEVTELENKRSKYGKDVITPEQVKTIKDAAKANLEYALSLKAGGEKGRIAELNNELETLKKYYEGDKELGINSVLNTKEYEQKKYETIRDSVTKSMDYRLAVEAGGTLGLQRQLDIQLADYTQFYDQQYLTFEELQRKKLDAVNDYNKKMMDANTTMYGKMAQVTYQFVENFGGTLNDMLWGSKTTFAEILESWGKMITQMIIEAYVLQGVMNGITGMFGGGSSYQGSSMSLSLPSGGYSYQGSSMSLSLPSGGSSFANGGIMTSRGPVPLRKYANGGIARSPQLAMFGEGAMAEAYVPLPDGRNIPVKIDNAKSAPSVELNITNNTDSKIEADNVDVRFDGEKWVIDVIMKAYSKNKNGYRNFVDMTRRG